MTSITTTSWDDIEPIAEDDLSRIHGGIAPAVAVVMIAIHIASVASLPMAMSTAVRNQNKDQGK